MMQGNIVDIAQVRPGMKLAEPVINPAGITLMPAGIRLTPMFIIRLKKWNVESVQVTVEPPSESSEQDERSGSKAQTRSDKSTSVIPAGQESFARFMAEDVAGRFVNLRDNPLMMRLRNIVIKKLLLHGPDGMLNVMRRGCLAKAEEES